MRKYLAGVIALLALAFTSLGSAAGWPSTAGTGPSGASHVTSTVLGQCSTAEAIDAVKRLGSSDASATYPVYKVLCGAFAGAAGARTSSSRLMCVLLVMVARGFRPRNGGSANAVSMRSFRERQYRGRRPAGVDRASGIFARDSGFPDRAVGSQEGYRFQRYG